MREVTDEMLAKRVQYLCGLDGAALDFVVNAATITAALGKFPSKVDACNYLGMSEHEMDSMSQKVMSLTWVDKSSGLKKWYYGVGITDEPRLKAMVYAIASDLTLQGLLEGSYHHYDQSAALLRAMFQPQQISSRAEFDGFLVTLEYLRHRERGLGKSLSKFMKMRYGALRKHNALAAFSEIVAGNDPDSFPQSDYSFVVHKLGELLDVCREDKISD